MRRTSSACVYREIRSVGNLLWTTGFGGENGQNDVYTTALVVSPDGKIYIAGNFEGRVDFDPGSKNIGTRRI